MAATTDDAAPTPIPQRRRRTTVGEGRRFAQRLRRQADLLVAGQNQRRAVAISADKEKETRSGGSAYECSPPPLPALSWMTSAKNIAREYRLSPMLQQWWLTAEPVTRAWIWQPETRDLLLRAGEEEYEGARGAVLVDPPGSGKTLTTEMTLLRSLQDHVRSGAPRFGEPAMIVVPKRLLPQWIDQLHQHFPPGVLTVHVVRAQSRGTTAVAAVLDADLDYIRYCIDIVLTTYETLRAAMRAALRSMTTTIQPAEVAAAAVGHDGDVDDDEEAPPMAAEIGPDHPARQRGLFGLNFRWLVGDEAVYIKNASSCNFAAMLWIRAPRRLLLTATPLPNARVSEFNALLRALGCRMQLSATVGATTTTTAAAASAVDESTRERIVRRFLVQSRIPPSHWRPPLVPEVRWLDFDTELERANYHAAETYLASQIGGLVRQDAAEADPAAEPTDAVLRGDRTRRQMLPAIAMLRGICLTPMLGLPKEDQVWTRAHCPNRPTPTKMAYVIRYVREQMQPDEKALVFAGRLQALEELSFHLERAGISHGLLHGGVSDEDALTLMRNFAREDGGGDDDYDPENPRLLLMTNIGIAGLNGLERANHTIIFEPDWSPGTDDQLSGRTNRPGQRRQHLYMIKLVLKGTVEENVNWLNQRKGVEQTAFLRLAATAAATKDKT